MSKNDSGRLLAGAQRRTRATDTTWNTRNLSECEPLLYCNGDQALAQAALRVSIFRDIHIWLSVIDPALSRQLD